MNRREFLKQTAAMLPAGAVCSAAAFAMRPRSGMGIVVHSYGIRRNRPLPPDYSSISEPIAFIEHCAALNAAGSQIGLGVRDAVYLDRLRDCLAKHAMYLEGIIGLPKDEADLPRFQAELQTAADAGISVLRTACLSGRRYEQFDSLSAFERFVRQASASLRLAEPLAARHKVRLAIENHKDWRIDELLGLLKQFDSEHLGVCVDTGNSIALLEDPHVVVNAYAPWALTTHFKDMGIREIADGFELSEVPLGQGFLDLPRIVAALRRARPEVRINLEMITRDPLKIPCLSGQYWATFPKLSGRELAEMLTCVRLNKHPRALPTVQELSQLERLRAEEANVQKSFEFASAKLKL